MDLSSGVGSTGHAPCNRRRRVGEGTPLLAKKWEEESQVPSRKKKRLEKEVERRKLRDLVLWEGEKRALRRLESSFHR